jgi:hypothetical protein
LASAVASTFPAEVFRNAELGLLVMVIALLAIVGGTIFYFFKTARQVLTQPVATSALNEI